MADLICCGLGNHDCSDGHSWGVGVRTEYIFHYIDKGCGYLECDGERHTVGEGQIFVIFPDTPVKYYPNPENPFFLSVGGLAWLTRSATNRADFSDSQNPRNSINFRNA